MKKISYVIIVALAILCIVLLHEKPAAPVASSLGMQAIPNIEVSAQELKKFQADKFVVHASLQMYGVEKESLFKKVGDRRKKILEIAKELEISESDVEQNSVELHKQWSYNDGVRRFAQYEATQSFAITVCDRQNAANLVEALSTENDVEVGRTTATLKNVDSLQKSVVDAAGKKALNKASMYAESVGAKLGKIISIGTGYGDGVVVNAPVMLARDVGMAKGVGFNHVDMGSVADSVTLSAEIRLVIEIK